MARAPTNNDDSNDINNDTQDLNDTELGAVNVPDDVIEHGDDLEDDDTAGDESGDEVTSDTEDGTGLFGTRCRVCEKELDTVQGRRSHETLSHQDIDLEAVAAAKDDGDESGDEDDETPVLQPEDAPDTVTTPTGDEKGDATLDSRADARERAGKDASRFWDDARDAFADASMQGSPTSRRDAQAIVIDALEREMSFMSVRERCDESHTDLWRWTDDNGWTDNAFLHIEERMEGELGSDSDKNLVRKVVHSLGARNRVTEDSLNGGDMDGTYVPVRNGVIDIEAIGYNAETMTIDTDTVELEPMDKDHRFTYRIQTRWDPENADLAGYDEWTGEVTMDRADDVRVLHEFVGHALHVRYPADGFLTVLGKGGSGKSQYLETVKSMIGGDNCSPIGIADIENNRFDAVHVVDSRLNVNTELDGVDLSSISTLKTLSAGEELKVEKKGVDAYFSRNDATLMFASDDPPAITAAQNDALGRRVYPIEFPMQYVDSPDPENPYELQAGGKLDVQDQLQADERLQALLVRAVEGLVRLLEEGNFTSESTREERLQRYNSYADPIKDFRRVCLVDAGPESDIESGLLAAVFDAFAEAKDHPGKSRQQIGSVLDGMQGISFSKGRTRSWSGDKTQHTVYSGMAFSAEAIRHYVPEGQIENLDLSALHDDDEEETRDSALEETTSNDATGDDLDVELEDEREEIVNVIEELAEANDDGAPVEDVRDEVRFRLDCDESDVDAAVDELMSAGKIYEPVSDAWRCT